MMLSAIVEEQGLGAPFSFIVARSLANRIDVSPIVFGLRVDGRVAVDLGC
jgi:hypothetical protein